MKKALIFTALSPFFANLAFAAPPSQGEPKPDLVRTEVKNNVKIAKPEQAEAAPEQSEKVEQISFSLAELQKNPQLTQSLLGRAIYSRDADLIEKLLAIYQTLPNIDRTLVLFAQGKIAAIRGDFGNAIDFYNQILAKQPDLNAVRVELAIALFQQKHNNAAKREFTQARSVENLPEPVKQLIDEYLEALSQRNEWNIDFSVNYVRETNVNRVANNANIEDTGYVKNKEMLPQSAHGLAYSLDISKDFNLFGSHYVSFENEFDGVSYWDHHDYDDISNRTSLGYSYKNANTTLRLLPFYERRWYGGEKYRWSNGVRAEMSQWLSSNWQLSTALEWAKQRYDLSKSQNGSNKLASATLVWYPNERQFFYLGTDFIAERTLERQYSSNMKSLRLGWGKDWKWGISSQLGLSFAHRDYKDSAVLGGLIPLDKVRQDRIYGVNLQLYKRDWNLWGITPKLVFKWRKQDSNLNSMYSYIERNANIVFEKRF